MGKGGGGEEGGGKAGKGKTAKERKRQGRGGAKVGWEGEDLGKVGKAEKK